MIELTDRQKIILTLLVHEHIRTKTPIGSQHLVRRYKLDMSSATVRNEMAALTEKGYLRQPYTSAGRVPSENGYRYFVSRLLNENELSESTRKMISHQFFQMRNDVDQWMRLAASILAHQSKGASLVTAPHPDQARLKHVEFISTRGRQVLMVLVLMGGEIHQRIVTLDAPVNQENLSLAAEKITRLYQGLEANSIAKQLDQLNDLENDLAKLLADDMLQLNALIAGEVYLDGLANVLLEPEFAESEDARRALKLLEEKNLLQEFLSRTVLRERESESGIQVLIGGEGTWDELRQCSVVLSRYGAPGFATGTLGVLGPMRMPYGKTISTIRFLSGLLSEMLTESMQDDTTIHYEEAIE